MLNMELSDLAIAIDPCDKYRGKEDEIINRASTMLNWLSDATGNKPLSERLSDPYGVHFSGWHSENALKPADDGGWDYPGDPRLYPYLVVAAPGEVVVFLPADVIMHLGPDAVWRQSRFD